MRDVIVNRVAGGLVTDLNEEVEKTSVLTKAENVDIVTTTDNNFVLQKRDGTVIVTDGNSDVEVPNATPIAVRQLNNVAYIVSIQDGGGGKLEIGTFPSPDWDNIIIKDLGVSVGAGNVVDSVFTKSSTATSYNDFKISHVSAAMSPSYRMREIEYIYVENTGIRQDTYELSMDTNVSWRFGDAKSNLEVDTASITIPPNTGVHIPIICNTAVDSTPATTATTSTIVTVHPVSGVGDKTVTVGVENIGSIAYLTIDDEVTEATVDEVTSSYITLKVKLGLYADVYAVGNTDPDDNDIVVYATNGDTGVPYKTEVIFDEHSTYLYKVHTHKYTGLEGVNIEACRQLYNSFNDFYYLKVSVSDYASNSPYIIVYYRDGKAGSTKQILVELNTPTGGGAV